MKFYPEGFIRYPAKFTKESLLRAMHSGTILESRALSYDKDGQLHFMLGDYPAVMPHDACADGVAEGRVRDVALMTRVGRSVCFVITSFSSGIFTLSRCAAQKLCQSDYLNHLQCGDVLRCRVTHIEPFGAFCDVGCGLSALLPIDCLSVSRIASPADRVKVGQDLMCVLKTRDAENRLVLSMKELLGTWAENAAAFHPGDTVMGIVRSVEPYGVFVELTPNLAGLAETDGNYLCGQTVSVYIKSILPAKMKIKLVILHTLEEDASAQLSLPSITENHIDRWVYSPPECTRVVETIFG